MHQWTLLIGQHSITGILLIIYWLNWWPRSIPEDQIWRSLMESPKEKGLGLQETCNTWLQAAIQQKVTISIKIMQAYKIKQDPSLMLISSHHWWKYITYSNSPISWSKTLPNLMYACVCSDNEGIVNSANILLPAKLFCPNLKTSPISKYF